MNTRSELHRFFTDAGFTEEMFAYLDDLRIFYRFRALHRLELFVWRSFKAIGVRYPESCLLGVYRKTPSGSEAPAPSVEA